MVGYIYANRLWIRIGDAYQSETSVKYIQASFNSGVFSTDVWTELEILTKYPQAKPLKSLIDIKEVWHQRD